MNPITAVVKGTTQTLGQGVQTAGGAIQREFIPPGIMYGLGMGIGPLIQNIVDQAKKSSDTPAKKEAKEGGGFQKKELNFLSAQFNTMISILRDIKNIGMLQIKNDQLKAFEERRSAFLQKESEAEALANKPGLSGTLSPKASSSKEGFDLAEVIPGILKIAGTVLAGKFIWDNLLDDDIKKDLKDKLGIAVGNIGDFIGNSLVDVIKSNPFESAIAGLIIARITGILGAIGLVGSLTYKGAKLAGGLAAGAGAAGAAAAAAAAATATNTSKESKPSVALSSTRVEPTLQSKPRVGLVPAPSPSVTPSSSMSATNAAMTQQATQSAGLLAKAGTLLGKIVPFVSAGLSGGLAYDQYKEGKNISATLNALSASLALGAGASAATGVGLPVAGAMGIGSLVAGLAAYGTSFFEKGSSEPTSMQQNNLQTAPVSSLSPSRTNEVPEEVVQALSAALGKRESSNNMQAENSLGFIGKYQFGVEALETLGYLKRGATEEMNKRGGVDGGGQQKILNNPEWWARYNKETFMRDGELQEKAFRELMQFNYNTLQKQGEIQPNTTSAQLAGMLSAMHLSGYGGIKAMKEGRTVRDAYGATNYDYYALGSQAMSSSQGGVQRQNIDSASNQKGVNMENLIGIVSDLMLGGSGASFIDQSQQVVNNVNGQAAMSAPPPQLQSRIGDAVRHID